MHTEDGERETKKNPGPCRLVATCICEQLLLGTPHVRAEYVTHDSLPCPQIKSPAHCNFVGVLVGLGPGDGQKEKAVIIVVACCWPRNVANRYKLSPGVGSPPTVQDRLPNVRRLGRCDPRWTRETRAHVPEASHVSLVEATGTRYSTHGRSRRRQTQRVLIASSCAASVEIWRRGHERQGYGS